jgi:hypothetical protein
MRLEQAGEVMAAGVEIRTIPPKPHHITVGNTEAPLGAAFHQVPHVRQRFFPHRSYKGGVLTGYSYNSSLRASARIGGSRGNVSFKTSPPNVSGLKDNRTVRPTYRFWVKDSG